MQSMEATKYDWKHPAACNSVADWSKEGGHLYNERGRYPAPTKCTADSYSDTMVFAAVSLNLNSCVVKSEAMPTDCPYSKSAAHNALTPTTTRL
jgi:hypothetical protein